MNLPAVYLPEAEDDIAAAHIYYERQRVRLGDAFVEALREAVDRIRNGPRLNGAILRDIEPLRFRRGRLFHAKNTAHQRAGWLNRPAAISSSRRTTRRGALIFRTRIVVRPMAVRPRGLAPSQRKW
jgi:hypothetical protein